MTGVVLQYILFGFDVSLVYDIRTSTPPLFEAPISEPFLHACGAEGATVLAPYTRPGLGNEIFPNEELWSFTRVEEMISQTKGFLARDWPLQLGWNNLRYILEAGLLEAKITNRTLVIPSFIYARACTAQQPSCAAYAAQVRRGPEIGEGDFGYLPEDQKQAWRLPIGLMVDIPRLREVHSVITVGEYLRLNGISPQVEKLDGHWDPNQYRIQGSSAYYRPSSSSSRGNLTISTLLQKDYEPTGVVRVDRLPQASEPLVNDYEHSNIYVQMLKELTEPGDRKSMSLAHAKTVVGERAGGKWKNEAEFEKLLSRHGWTIVYTFKGTWMEMMKTVTEPETEVSMTSQLHGIWDEYANNNSDILYIEGEIHSNMKPGSLRFTSAQERMNFASMVLRGVRPIASTRFLAETLAKKMIALNHGRMFLSAHMRRGDFVTFGWAPAKSIEGHLEHIEHKLDGGRKLLDEIWRSHAPPRMIDVPGVTPDTFFENSAPPLKNDFIFIATDERNATSLGYLRSHNVKLISDLLTEFDRRIVGWPLLFSDVLAQVEMIVASHGAFFWGHSMSSVAGGIVNLRGARGMDPRTALVD